MESFGRIGLKKSFNKPDGTSQHHVANLLCWLSEEDARYGQRRWTGLDKVPRRSSVSQSYIPGKRENNPGYSYVEENGFFTHQQLFATPSCEVKSTH